MRRQTCLFLLILPSIAPGRALAVSRVEEYALILEDPPLARQISWRQAPRIQAAQQRLRAELARRMIPASGAAHTLLNAVFVRVPVDRAADLRGLPGVKRVAWMPRLKRHLNTAVDLVNVTSAWNAFGGLANAGAGIKIGILDSGIDDAHPALQGASLSIPPGYPKGDPYYTNHKIIVARNYEPMFARPDDPTPRDRSGHGTALAMIAAGDTVAAPLATIAGVAPSAWLGNYKIFGTPGVNDLTYGSIVIQALEDAYSDGMDIVVLAFGDPAVYGPLVVNGVNGVACAPKAGVPPAYQDVCDVAAEAVENAATSMGMTVVVSAGNDAQTSAQPPALNSINSPGTAPSAITVGASTNAHVFFAAVEVNGARLDARVGDGPKLAAPLTAPLQDVAALDSTGLACAPLPGGWLVNAIALIARGNCDFSTKINHAAQAGALAVVLYQDDPSALPFGALGARNTGIPAMMIGNADGLALQGYLASNPYLQATLDPAQHEETAYANMVADFSSRGPSIDYAVKPELVAVGEGIYTATESLDPGGDLYDPTGYTAVDGSSFAVAMVAGAAALVKQVNPLFTPAQIKSALVNTASIGPNDIYDNPSYGEPMISAAGGGKLNAAAALNPGATVEPATVSFGWVGPGSAPVPASLTLTNTLAATASFNIAITPVAAAAGDMVTVSGSSLQLLANQQGTVTVSLEGGFQEAGNFNGFINITGPGTYLSVPYQYLASDGQPFDILPVIGSSFFGVVNDACRVIGFKILDQFGLPVPNAPVGFLAAGGGGAVSADPNCPSDAQTDMYGIAAAHVDLGAAVGEQSFTGTGGGMIVSFMASVRPLPTLTPPYIVDAAGFQAGNGLAPGSYAAIFGAALSDTTGLLSTTFLPFSMAGISVSFTSLDGTLSLPGRLWFVSPTQINVQIPWELAGQTSAQVVVSIGEIASAAYTTPMASYLPEMFQYGNHLAIAQDTNYQLVSSGNPARRGGAIMIYANGLGPVSHTPPSGEASPGPPLAETLVRPTVTIDGVDAPVLFSGLSPGSIALYQVNVAVPQGARPGLRRVVISQNGVQSQTASLPVQ